MQNWHDLEQVKAFANKLARMSRMQQTVYKEQGAEVYNIMHTDNEAQRLPAGAEVVHRTGNYGKGIKVK